MAGWATDDEFAAGLGIAAASAAQDGPFRASANSTKSSRRSVTPPGSRSSPVRLADGPDDETPSMDATNDESISILDPRRFTPTLHANLVSEILALRRDQEEKTKQIECLESSLHAAKGDQERLQASLTDATKEGRSLKRQLALLEGGTSSALSELARERDEAVDSVAEARKRLDAAQRKIRKHEDDSQRVHDLWAQEKINWADEQRRFERKVHVTESRLKTVLDELAAYQAAHHDPSTNQAYDSDREQSDADNDFGSLRTLSITNSIRKSLCSPVPGVYQGQCLADELNFDDDHTDADGRESVLSHHPSPKRNSRVHRRNQSLDSLRRAGSVTRRRPFTERPVSDVLEDGEEDEGRPAALRALPAYTDAGIQYSPPASPEPPLAKPATPDMLARRRTPDIESPRGDSEIEANQRRKRVQVSRPLRIEAHRVDHKMVSAAAQTVEEPLSPPKTPQTPCGDSTPAAETKLPAMTSSSTQTEEQAPAQAASAPRNPPPLLIPTISIQPPRSRPTTPRSPRLPQHSKDLGCQVKLPPAPISDASVQTEGIQIDKRLARLPPHLQPSAITSRPSSPGVAGGSGREADFTPAPGGPPARNPRRLTQGGDAPETPPTSTVSHCEEDERYEFHATPGGTPGGPSPPANARRASTRRSRRLSSLFAGFDTASSDGMDEFGDAYMSDVEYHTPPSAPRPQPRPGRPPKRGSLEAGARPPGEPSTAPAAADGASQPASTELYSSFSLVDRETRVKSSAGWRPGRAHDKPPAPAGGPATSLSRQGAMRRTALIQSGIASHQMRSRSPSWPEPANPPFPIPTRASSRKPGGDGGSPSEGRSSPTRAGGWSRAGGGASSSSSQARGVRKVRSAAALSRVHGHARHGSRSPPPLSPSAESPESLGLPPLPDNDITSPGRRDVGRDVVRDVVGGQHRGHRHELSTNTDHTNMTEHTSRTSGSQSVGVVDAIAHAMVGEWMLKYVRRRRSFGMPENTGKDDSSNDRHKRWVWLAPYERAILWSSKQPSSGSALMGKSGRKLTIQSVLDVKDDNAGPKVMPSVFNRSILILTPQRALKFTAASAERHYLWLTALSFLAHSSQAVPEVLAPRHLQVRRQQQQQQQQPLPEFEMPRTRFRRGGIRDSIRLAKGRAGAPKAAAPPSRAGDADAGGGGSSGRHSRGQSAQAAEPPSIPRFGGRAMMGHAAGAAHGRKRSNTGGAPGPPLSFRGFSGPLWGGGGGGGAGAGSAGSVGTANSCHSQASTRTAAASPPGTGAGAGAAVRPGGGNFFDAIGTVRMEAFISPLAMPRRGECADGLEELEEMEDELGGREERRPAKARRRSGGGRGGGRMGGGEPFGRRGGRGVAEEDLFKDDPFDGF